MYVCMFTMCVTTMCMSTIYVYISFEQYYDAQSYIINIFIIKENVYYSELFPKNFILHVCMYARAHARFLINVAPPIPRCTQLNHVHHATILRNPIPAR